MSERTYPDLTDMIVEMSKVKPMSKRKFYIQLNLLKRDGVSLEEVSRRYNVPINELEQMTVGTKANIVYTLPQQVNCPNCNGIVLTPPMTLRSDAAEYQNKQVNCVHCNELLDVVINNQDKPIDVAMLNKPVQVPDAFIKGTQVAGVQFTTMLFYKIVKNNYIVRAGIAIMGGTNHPCSVGACPFDQYFLDNYCEGTSNKSLAVAIEKLYENYESTVKSLFE